MLSKLLLGFLAAFGLVLLPAIAAAQSTTEEAAKRRQKELQTNAPDERPVDAAGTAVPVTFEDVLAKPSDPGVNLAYARQLIAGGRLELASATLERILLQYPELNDVRLLYAVVLYRLGSLDEARSEFELLLSRDTTPAIRAEAERYHADVVDALDPLKSSASFSIGIHHDTNRNAYPRSGNFTILDTSVQGTDSPEGDYGWLAIGTAEFRYDVGDQMTQEIGAKFSAITDDQAKFSTLDVRAGIAEFDLLQRTSLADLRPRLRYSYVALHQRKYVAESSVGMRVERRLATPGWQIFGDGELGYEDYSNTRDVPFAAEQEGRYIQAKSGAYYVVSPSLRLMGALRYRDKDADKRYEDYQLWGVEGSLVQVFENNTYLSFDASLDWQRYGQADPFISTTKDRTDKDWIFNVTYGIPLLQAITVFDSDATMPEGWDDLDLTLTGGYQRQESNIPNFSYNNWRAQVLVTKRWNF